MYRSYHGSLLVVLWLNLWYRRSEVHDREVPFRIQLFGIDDGICTREASIGRDHILVLHANCELVIELQIPRMPGYLRSHVNATTQVEKDEDSIPVSAHRANSLPFLVMQSLNLQNSYNPLALPISVNITLTSMDNEPSFLSSLIPRE